MQKHVFDREAIARNLLDIYDDLKEKVSPATSSWTEREIRWPYLGRKMRLMECMIRPACEPIPEWRTFTEYGR
ncbi:MAG: hypothetical protein A4E36_01070 [Methanoregulaceae archaeon PtaB.Bin009]|nr:MAG: hypothetical protein A4E36_01070 [Methanoregulaceae archaeon PtaB.Bin009]OPY40131.1 MAG: hypothetical protein A4E41_01511 [Methanoregulaceae archaeon PtaU1.Bin066]